MKYKFLMTLAVLTSAWALKAHALVLAVIDTGVDTQHKRLKTYLWQNPGEVGQDANGNDRSANGVDDDGNGYIDDVYGWNFAAKSSDVSDSNGHGTHISGLLVRDLKQSGIRLMTLKYYDPRVTQGSNLNSFTESLRYAIAMKADVINISGGGASFSSDEYELIKSAEAKGIKVCAAAGNEASNTKTERFYPASYKAQNVFSVAAVDQASRLLASSNYGEEIDFALLGKDLMSALPGGGQGLMTGTSQATAVFCNSLVALLNREPALSFAAIRSRMVSTGLWSSHLSGKTQSGVVPDKDRLLNMKDTSADATGTAITTEAPSDLIYGG